VTRYLDDRDSFASFYRAHSRALLLFFTRRTFDAEISLDLTAETFARAFASRQSFRGATAAEAGGWLFTIASRQLNRYYEAGSAERKLTNRLGIATPVASEPELERIEELAGLGALRAALRDSLSALDAGQREALWLRVVDEQPYAAVAATLGITEQAARTRVSRALKAVGAALTANSDLIEESV
jgi:RNA polymerase sigma-70 factor (ECF subfamily)